MNEEARRRLDECPQERELGLGLRPEPFVPESQGCGADDTFEQPRVERERDVVHEPGDELAVDLDRCEDRVGPLENLDGILSVFVHPAGLERVDDRERRIPECLREGVAQ